MGQQEQNYFLLQSKIVGLVVISMVVQKNYKLIQLIN